MLIIYDEAESLDNMEKITDIDSFIEKVIYSEIVQKTIIYSEDALSKIPEDYLDILKSSGIKLIKKEDIEKIKKRNILPLKFFIKKMKKVEKQIEEEGVEKENIELDLNLISPLNNMKYDLARGENFRKYLEKNNILDSEEIEKIDNRVSSIRREGKKVYFLETAIKMNMLSERKCAEILSVVLKSEVICSDDIDRNKLIKLNKDILKFNKNFIIIDKNDEKKELIIGKDLGSDDVDLEIIEFFYIGYDIVVKNLVDGTSEKIIKELKLGGI